MARKLSPKYEALVEKCRAAFCELCGNRQCSGCDRSRFCDQDIRAILAVVEREAQK
jgi:hypothetical protein